MDRFLEKHWLKFLILILVISAFFRLYGLNNFQFWTSDEETGSIVIYKMIKEKKPILIIPQATVEFSLGPYWYYISAPFFWASNNNPQIVLAFMGFLGLITTFLIFKIGEVCNNTRLGLSAAFLYSSSFVVGLFDRRWWQLTPHPLFSALAILSILKINQKKYIYIVPLAVSLSFAFHTELAIAIIAPVAIISFFILKIPFLKKEYLLGLIILLIFLLPLIFFELRHPNTIVHPIISSFSKTHLQRSLNIYETTGNLITQTSSIFTNIFFPKPSDFAENYVASAIYPSWLPRGITLIFSAFILYPLWLLLRGKVKREDKPLIKVLASFLGIFFISSYLYVIFYNHSFFQQYFSVIFPAIFLMAGYSIIHFTKNRNGLFVIILIIYLMFNLTVMASSSFKYPLYQKRTMVRLLSNQIGSSNFSLYSVGDAHFIGGGYTTLFIFNNKHPKRSDAYDYYDWVYRAYSLYTITPENTDQEKVVIISKMQQSFPADKILYQTKVGNIFGMVLENRTHWFEQGMLQNN